MQTALAVQKPLLQRIIEEEGEPAPMG